jgi:polar amino acid transport system substrate-binding protein
VKNNIWSVALVFLSFFLVLISIPAHSEERTLTIGTSYKTLLSEPDQSGMLDRIVKEAFLRIGITVDIPFLPAERSIMLANTGIHDGELNRIEGIERLYPNLVRVPESNMDFNFVAFSKKQDFATTDWSTLKSMRVGFIKGWKILEENLKDHPDVVYANSAEQLFKQLDKGHIDVALYGELVGCGQLKKMSLTDVKVLSPPLATRKMYMYLNEKHKGLTVKVAESLREMKRDGSYDRIVEEAKAPYLNGSKN